MIICKFVQIKRNRLTKREEGDIILKLSKESGASRRESRTFEKKVLTRGQSCDIIDKSSWGQERAYRGSRNFFKKVLDKQ